MINTMLTDLWAALLYSILVALSCVTTVWLFNHMRNGPGLLPPGPPGLPIVGNLLSLDPNLHAYFATLARSYGPIFSLRLGSKLGIVITSPMLTKEILKDKDITFANRDVPAAARISSYGGADIVWIQYGPEWRLLRKVCVREMLSPAALEAVRDIRQREMHMMIKLLASQAGQPVNIGEQMFVTLMNVVTDMMWGGTVKIGKEKDSLGREFRGVVTELTRLLGVPNVSDFFPGLARFELQGIEKKMRTCSVKFDEIFERVINQRLSMDEGEEKQKDFLDVLLQLQDYNENKVEFSITHLKALLLDMVLGGTGTTSNTMDFAMAEIINKPAILEKIQQELDSVVGNNNTVEEHHIFKLPYLQAVIKESLRLHPILPLLVPHSPSESCIIGGYNIPKGSRVFINVWAIHRDPSIWDNPLEFDPERFMNTKYDFNGNDFRYLPFGSGRRICPGIAMADRTMLLSMATLLHSFNWRLPQGKKMNFEEKFGIVLSKKDPLVIIPEPRLSNHALYE